MSSVSQHFKIRLKMACTAIKNTLLLKIPALATIMAKDRYSSIFLTSEIFVEQHVLPYKVSKFEDVLTISKCLFCMVTLAINILFLPKAGDLLHKILV